MIDWMGTLGAEKEGSVQELNALSFSGIPDNLL